MGRSSPKGKGNKNLKERRFQGIWTSTRGATFPLDFPHSLSFSLFSCSIHTRDPVLHYTQYLKDLHKMLEDSNHLYMRRLFGVQVTARQSPRWEQNSSQREENTVKEDPLVGDVPCSLSQGQSCHSPLLSLFPSL